MRLPTIVLILAAAVILTQGPLVSTAHAAPQSLSVKSTVCQPDGKVTANFTWFPADAHWLDVSTDAGFATWSNAYVFGVVALLEPFSFGGLNPSTTYYARTTTPSGGNWLTSNIAVFTTPNCSQQAEAFPIRLGAPNLACLPDGQVRTAFSWTPPRAGTVYLDVSLDSQFRGWANTPIGPGISSHVWTGLNTNTVYFARLGAPGGQLSNVVSFTTPSCGSHPCHPSYPGGTDAQRGGCIRTGLGFGDYDCWNNGRPQGDGPNYAIGPFQVVGVDSYGLDADNDGIGCENG